MPINEPWLQPDADMLAAEADYWDEQRRRDEYADYVGRCAGELADESEEGN